MLPAEHLEDRGITNREVLRVVRSVPREEFVPAALRAAAFDDKPLEIGYGATISQPYMVAAMTQLLDLAPHHRVLEIGTGSGYQAAILSGLVREVYSIENVPELAALAIETLQRLGYRNVVTRTGDGYLGWADAAPFDRILLTAAPKTIPATLFAQLAEGGRMVAPEGNQQEQQLMVIDKKLDGSLRPRAVFPVLFVPMLRG